MPFFLPLVHGDPFNQWHEILSQNTRDSTLTYLYCENQKSLSPGLQLVPSCDRQTDRHQDRITIELIGDMLALVRSETNDEYSTCDVP